jgi:hypothetical protein
VNNKGNAPDTLADAELRFEDGALEGLKLIGFRPGPVMVGSWSSRRNHTSRFRGGQNGYDSDDHPHPDRHLPAVGHLTVDPHSDEHLHDQQGIRDEAASWLESLDATVHGVSVRKVDLMFPIHSRCGTRCARARRAHALRLLHVASRHRLRR